MKKIVKKYEVLYPVKNNLKGSEKVEKSDLCQYIDTYASPSR